MSKPDIRIAVAPTPTALIALSTQQSPDVLVLWERISQADAEQAAKSHPTSYTISGEWRGKAIWGVIRRGTIVLAEYRKIADDDRYSGFPDGGEAQNPAMYYDEEEDWTIAVLVCRDVDCPPMPIKF